MATFTNVPVNQLTILYVSSFYDIPLLGICRYSNKICKFTCDYDTRICVVTALSLSDRIIWFLRKKAFEICVGKHWSYPFTAKFTNKHPLLFKIYYKFVAPLIKE